MTAPNPNAYIQMLTGNPGISTVTTADPSQTGAVTSPDGFLPTVHLDPSEGQPGFGVIAPLPENSTIVSNPLSVTDQIAQVNTLMSSLSSFPETFEFLALPPEVNAARLTFGLGNVPLRSANAAYTAMAGALQTAAGTSDGSTDTMAVVWKGPSSDRAQAAFRHHAGWLRQQADVATNSAKIASSSADAYMAAVGTMPPVAECLAAKAAAAAAATAAAGSGGVATMAFVHAETYYNVVLRGQAATSMTTYSAAAHTVLSGLPTSTPPPQISSDSSGGILPQLSGGGTTGSGLTSLSTLGNGLTSLADDGGNTLTSTTSQAATTVGDSLANQASNAASNLGQTAGQQLPSLGEGDSALQNALNPPGGDQLPGYADYAQQHDPFGLAPYSSTLDGLYGGSGSMVAMSMVRGGFGTMSGAATGFRMPANWAPRVARAFGALDEQAPPPMASSAAPRGASAPAEQMRRDKDKRKKSGKVIAPGEDQNVPVLDEVPAIGVLEFADEEIVDELADDLSLSFGVLDNFDEDAQAQHVTGDSHRD